MTLLDVSIVNVALPSIQHGLGANGSALEWIVSGYTLALGLLLIPAGRLGDNIGHKKTFLFGLGLFTLSSLACALAQSPAEIIISRFVQGLGAGIYTPPIIAFVQLLFQGRARSQAFSVYGAVIGVATAVGPLLGGILVHLGGDDFGWRLVFLVNVPVALVLLPVAYLRLPPGKSEHKRAHRLDPLAIVGVAGGLLLILFPLVEGQQYGWPWWTWVSFAVGAAVLAATWQWEKHIERVQREPLLAVHVLRRLSFSLSAMTAFFYFAAFSSIFFVLSILWQSGLGRSALETGLMLSPFALGNLIGSSQSYKTSARFGRKALAIGCGLYTLSLVLVLLLLAGAGDAPSAWMLAIPLFIGGLGSGTFIAPNQDFALHEVPGRDAGSASGMFNTAQRVGASLGIAAVGTTLFSGIHVDRSHDLAAAFVSASDTALRVNMVLILIALVLVFVQIRRHSSDA